MWLPCFSDEERGPHKGRTTCPRPRCGQEGAGLGGSNLKSVAWPTESGCPRRGLPWKVPVLARAQQVQGSAPQLLCAWRWAWCFRVTFARQSSQQPLEEALRAPLPVEETEAQRKGVAWPGLTQTGTGRLGAQGRSFHPCHTEAIWPGSRVFELEHPVYPSASAI